MLTFIIPDNASAADIDKSLINQTMKRVMKAVDEFRPKREDFIDVTRLRCPLLRRGSQRRRACGLHVHHAVEHEHAGE